MVLQEEYSTGITMKVCENGLAHDDHPDGIIISYWYSSFNVGEYFGSELVGVL